MKRGTPDHPKTLDLMQRLGVDQAKACGTLELLWHFTARYAPAGDVGRWTNAVIANAVGWAGDPDHLVEQLRGAGFLDTPEQLTARAPSVRTDARLIVHGWSEHADDWVHIALCRALGTFADGTAPSDKRLPKKERKDLAEKRAQRALLVRTESAQPSRAVPSQGDTATNPPQTPPASAGGAQARALGDQLATLYRKLLGKAPGGRLVRHWRTELRQGVDPGAIVALIEAQAAAERCQAEAAAEERARWEAARARLDRHGGNRIAAVAALDWCERNRGPGETIDQALGRWADEGGFPREVLVVMVTDLYDLRKAGRGERSPPAPAGKATSRTSASTGPGGTAAARSSRATCG